MCIRDSIEGHGDGRGQIRLNLHALFRAHEYLPAVNVGVKIYPLFLDSAKSCQRKNLEPAGIRQDRLVPDHELVKASQFLYHCIPWPDMQLSLIHI